MLEPPPGSQMLVGTNPAQLEEDAPAMKMLRAPMDPGQGGYWDEHANEADFEEDGGTEMSEGAMNEFFNFPLLDQQVETKLPERLRALEKQI